MRKNALQAVRNLLIIEFYLLILVRIGQKLHQRMER